MNSSTYICTLEFIFTKSAKASLSLIYGLPVHFYIYADAVNLNCLLRFLLFFRIFQSPLITNIGHNFHNVFCILPKHTTVSL